MVNQKGNAGWAMGAWQIMFSISPRMWKHSGSGLLFDFEEGYEDVEGCPAVKHLAVSRV
jgi:hypothetical protein